MATFASLSATDISYSIGRHEILNNVSLRVLPGRRIGLTGPNGTGKTTLLRILAGQLLPDKGRVTATPPDAAVGYLTQEPEIGSDESARDYILRRTGISGATIEYEAATRAVADGEPGAGDRFSVALEHWLARGAVDVDARLGTLCADLGIEERILEQEMRSLSGGEAARIGLAALLLSHLDILLLDEPTNDLDLDGLDRLEAFVLSQQQGMVIVSHDRSFLERVVTDVAEIDEHARTLSTYAGGWQAFQDERATARRHAEEAFEDYATRADTLKARAQREREWSTVGVVKNKKMQPDKDVAGRKARAESTEQLAARASRTERMIERLEVVDKPWEGWDLRLEIAPAERSGSVTARLTDVVVRQGAFTLGPITLEIGWAERIALVGPNGSGKSSLISTLLGRLPVEAGERWLGPSVVVGEMTQARNRFTDHASLLQAFLDSTGLTNSEGRSLLAKFGLTSEHVTRPADSLSPGERTRAVLALFMAQGVNFLVLDEPTNHLDLPAIEQLEQALATYRGTLLLVTHDRRLLDNVEHSRTLRLDGGRLAEVG